MELMRSRVAVCLHCGSLQALPGLLCDPCQQTLLTYRVLEGIQTTRRWKSLFRWTPGESDLLSGLILSLKGAGSQRAWNFYAAAFAQKYIPTLPTGRRLRLVPAPSKTGGRDHAFLFAQALAEQCGADFCPCLGKVSQKSQRGGTRGDRALIEMELIEKNTVMPEDWSEVLWIFVDDIVTTGATARAAELALGRPPHFEVWVLAERSLSCGASTDLL